MAVCQDLPETYENVAILLNLIKAHEVKYLLSCDIKIANIICGIQSHSSMHPCCWHDIPSKSLCHTGSPRAIEYLNAYHRVFTDSGADMKNAKAYSNALKMSFIRQFFVQALKNNYFLT